MPLEPVSKTPIIPVLKDNTKMSTALVKVAMPPAKLALMPVLVKHVMMVCYGFKRL